MKTRACRGLFLAREISTIATGEHKVTGRLQNKSTVHSLMGRGRQRWREARSSTFQTGRKKGQR